MSYLKSRLFLNYALSYLLILLVPLLLFAGAISQSATGNLQREVERAHYNQLVQARHTVDSRMRELSMIATRIAYDTRLTNYRTHDPYYGSEAIQALDQYMATSAMIGELFLYFHGDDRIFSSKGMSGMDVFHERYAFHNWPSRTVETDLDEAKFPAMRPADLVQRTAGLQQSMLAYMVPITPGSPNPHATVLYLIEESQLGGLIASILGSYQGSTFVFDDKGQVLTATRRGESLGPDDIRRLFRQPEGTHSLELNGTKHSVVSVKSEQNGWTYVTAVPSSQFFSSVVELRNILVLLLGAVAAGGAGLALIMARRHYGPISDLAAYASSSARQPGAAKAADELGRIRSVLQYSTRMADLQEPYARNHFLLMLLKHGGSGSVAPELLQALQLGFDRERYAVLVAGWEEEQPEAGSVYGRLRSLSIPEADAAVYGVELPEPRRMAFIVGMKGPDGERSDPLGIVLGKLRPLLEDAGAIRPTIGAGRLYEGPGPLSQSYIEALSAFESAQAAGAGTAQRFDLIPELREEASWLPAGPLLKLAQALKQGSYEVAAATIAECVAAIRASVASAPLLRAMGYEVQGTMLRSAPELGPLARQLPPPSAFRSPDALEQALLGLAAQICSQAESRSLTEERSLMDRAVQHIHERYADHSLSLESVADEHGISPSHFSRSFKEKTGLNFTAYVWQLRIDEVKRQLDATADPLKDIIQRVGYLDTPNFIRKFKKETGMTPGQYRKRGEPGGGAGAE
ncbi:AraC family transcriptional regulator [Paenibacillus pasadenensis]|uniref:Transcriptional regulator, AraC family n=1 Tax=Paenibacillus pasadenensis TaxID=217090 RepID=A0A2N5ND18_9BACL|nr:MULTISPECIES: AraC family transcriptional regulator [Paenibacillus]PLT48246.1 Transcriptional regulator, AraC family [Paenibacillus pasadenensis]QGG58250.1 helix-turn-helix domain-containing protein [Paenibacillus sp. B01]